MKPQYHLILTRRATVKQTKPDNKCWREYEITEMQNGIAGGNVSINGIAMENNLVFSPELKSYHVVVVQSPSHV